MNRQRFDRVQELFWLALERELSARPSFLTELRTQDAELADEVASLLAADARAERFLSGSPGGALEALGRLTWPVSGDPASPPPLDRIDQYTIVKPLGDGGAGVVYLARQTEPVRREVALKVIKPGMDTREVIRRFKAERQALAVMDHPGIAKVFDGGITESGRPYFVMELVRGVPITEYCDSNRLSIAARLRIFADTCLAVQHAHQKGLIHRDLKPSNILVTLQNDRPVPKVIDFGIAKAMGQSLTDATLQTVQGRIIGTPAYMSPEQAGVTGLDADTRADIYSLGVVLYELLTGHLPFQADDLRGGAVVATLRDLEPPTPSTRFRTLSGPRDGIAGLRATDPRGLGRKLSGDLDRIVMKAIAKDRTRRYETANGLALDVRRYLNHEPISARALDRRAYRVVKFVRRNRIPTGAAALAVLSLIAGLGAALWQASVAGSERDRAYEARREAEQALAQSESVTDLLIGLFEFSDPRAANVDYTTAGELVRQGLAQAEEVRGQPEVQARMFHALGRLSANLGDYEQAERLVERGLRLRRTLYGGRDPRVAESLDQLATILRRRGDYTRADTLFGEALAILRESLGVGDPAYAGTLFHRGYLKTFLGQPDAAESIYRQVLYLRDQGLDPQDPMVAEAMVALANTIRFGGRFEEAEAFARDAVDLRRRIYGPVHPEVASAMLSLADLLAIRGESRRAEALFREVLDMLRGMEVSPQELFHPLTSLGDVRADFGDLQEAEALFRENLELRLELFGPDNPNVAEGMDQLASLLVRQGKYDDAETLKRRALEIWRNAVGDQNSSYAGSLAGLGHVLTAKGDIEEAEVVFRQVLAVRQRLAPGSPASALAMAELADVLGHRGYSQEAERLALNALQIVLAHYDASAPSAQRVYSTLAQLYEEWDKPSEAARYRRQMVGGS